MQVINPVSVSDTSTHTRASVGRCWDIFGANVEKAIDEARYQWNPATGVFEGVLWEPARTNLLLNSSTLSTQTRTVTNGTEYTLSFYGTGSITITGTTSVGGSSASSRVVTGTGATVWTTLTFTAGTTSLTFTVSGSCTKAQLEAGGWATSWIATTGSSASRSADLFSGDGMFNTTFTDATAAYAGGTTYAVGDRVQYSHRIYESARASNTGHTPAHTATAWHPGIVYASGDVREYKGIVYTSLANDNVGNQPDESPSSWAIWWLLVGPANDFAMFDRAQSTASVADNGYQVFAFKTSEEVNAVCLHGIEADTVYVAVSNGAGGLATQTVTVVGGTAWVGDLSVPGGTTGGAVVSVYATRASGVVTITEFVAGTIHTLGETDHDGLSFSISDYSQEEEDGYGGLKFTRGAFRKIIKAKVVIDTTANDDDLTNITRLLAYLRRTPCSWNFGEGVAKYAYIGITYGVYESFDVLVPYATYSLCELRVKGLSEPL